MALDSSLARNRTVCTTSSSSTRGCFSPIWATLSAVRTVAGATALTRMFASRYSRASSRVRPATGEEQRHGRLAHEEGGLEVDGELAIEELGLHFGEWSVTEEPAGDIHHDI